MTQVKKIRPPRVRKNKVALPDKLSAEQDLAPDYKTAAAQCWQDETTKSTQMDPILAEVVAKKMEELVGKERLRIVTLILKEKDRMAIEYKHTIKQTGNGLLTKSMVYAFTKAINEIFKLINTTKRNPDEQKEQRV